MTVVNKGSASAADEKIDLLEKELAGTQQMLGLVLLTIGEPVIVPKELIKKGLGNYAIQIDDNIEEGAFIFGLVQDD